MRAVPSGLAAALTLAAGGIATAQEVSPSSAYRIDLGEVGGVAYYTVANDGYRVVATLGSGNAPVRFTATLAPAQRMNISVPGAVGARDQAIDIVRDGNRILVMPAGVLSN